MQVTATAVSFAYPRSPSLFSRVDFHIEAGEAVALMGPSGSGKTTMLQLIGGLDSPSAGEIRWDGNPPDYRRADLVAWVFQTVNVVPRRTTRDNVAMGLYPQGLHWADCIDRSSEIIETLGLGHCVNRRVEDLSGGELQRVVIARALVGAPRMILADEPTGQLDAATSRDVIRCLLEQRPISTTVIVATHDPAVAERCERILRLEDGTIRETTP